MRDLSDVKNDVSNKVYEAVIGIFESLENEGIIYGNGHHMAQEVCEKVEKMIEERFNLQSAVKKLK